MCREQFCDFNLQDPVNTTSVVKSFFGIKHIWQKEQQWQTFSKLSIFEKMTYIMSSFLIGQWLRTTKTLKKWYSKNRKSWVKTSRKTSFFTNFGAKNISCIFSKNLEISRKGKNLSKFVYIFPKQCRCHFNLPIFWEKFQNSNFAPKAEIEFF